MCMLATHVCFVQELACSHGLYDVHSNVCCPAPFFYPTYAECVHARLVITVTSGESCSIDLFYVTSPLMGLFTYVMLN